jgi:hypothetical protein
MNKVFQEEYMLEDTKSGRYLVVTSPIYPGGDGSTVAPRGEYAF